MSSRFFIIISHRTPNPARVNPPGQVVREMNVIQHTTEQRRITGFPSRRISTEHNTFIVDIFPAITLNMKNDARSRRASQTGCSPLKQRLLQKNKKQAQDDRLVE
jgi:hypothetical protein